MSATKLTVGSLFSGIGGFELGFERAGMDIKWQCEIDEYCRKVLANHWPNAERFTDVRGLKPSYVDVLCGGFPCQDISVAGHQVGITGARSGLWSEFIRIAREIRPKYIVAENVSALKAKGLNTVLADIAESGYDAEWQCIPANAFGAPHQRDRIWIVAYPNSDEIWQEQVRNFRQQKPAVIGANGQTQSLADTNGVRCDRRTGQSSIINRRTKPANSSSNQDVANATSKRLQRRIESKAAKSTQRQSTDRGLSNGQWAAEPNVGRVAHGVPNRVDRIKSLGNALVPQIAQYIGERIIEHDSTRIY